MRSVPKLSPKGPQRSPEGLLVHVGTEVDGECEPQAESESPTHEALGL